MKSISLARIGNSRGIRIPVGLIKRHGLESGVVLEDRGTELVIRATSAKAKLSWRETAMEMAAEQQDFSEWDDVASDGLESIPWEPAKPARKTLSGKSTPRSRSES